MYGRQSRGKEVKIAIIDTGIDFSHPDLADNVQTGINLFNPQLLAGDDHGHGTHIAGIIAAVDNDAGAVGIASDAHLYPVKASNQRGEGSLADVIRALDWCIEKRMDVINMSFGIDRRSQALHTAIRVQCRRAAWWWLPPATMAEIKRSIILLLTTRSLLWALQMNTTT